MAERDPVMYTFGDREAMLMRAAFHKKFGVGHTVSGEMNTQAAKRLEEAGLVTVEPWRGDKVIVKPTRRGREAWINQGLRAAGRPLTRLDGV